MSVGQDELQKIAQKLSKIPGDNTAILHQLNDILEYMELLGEVDTRGVEPTISVVEQHARLREDTCDNSRMTSPQELLACSSQKVVQNQIVLPNIMK